MNAKVWLLPTLLAGLMLSCPRAARAGALRVGAAAVEITPPKGTPMSGYYAFRAVRGVLDPIHAKAIVVEQDGDQAALVAVDLGTIMRPVVEAARQEIEARCGIPGARVMISATHTHSAPQVPRGSLIDAITKADSPAGQAYLKTLPTLIAQSVVEAHGKLAPARASAAIGNGEGISFNRRVLRAGSDQALWQPLKIDPAKERPAGPVDPDIGVLAFHADDDQAAPLAAYLNFAMHPTSVGAGTRISADYPGVLCRLMCQRHGPGMMAMFTNGCCGDINHTDYIRARQPTTEELGTRLADAAGAAWKGLRLLTTCPPRVRSEQVTLTRRTYTEAQIANAHHVADRMLKEKLGTVEMAEAVSILDTTVRKDEPLLVEVQAIAFSEELAIVSMPGEIFVEMGLDLKKASPFQHTFIAELANGSIGYVPTRQAYAQGNYEVVSARAVAGSGEKLVEVALRLLKELHKTRSSGKES